MRVTISNSKPSLAPRTAFSTCAVSLICLLPLAGVQADDRDLVRTSSSDPYVFVLFDNTYSMTQDLDGARSSLYDDGEDSRIFLAKEALDLVLLGTPDVNFGFATFPNFSGLRAVEKHCDGECIGPAWNGRNDEDGLSNTIWCQGWEGNNDDTQDKYSGYNIMYETLQTPSGLDLADMVPFDWEDNNINRIRERLAPNLAIGEQTADYGVARYFRDEAGQPVNEECNPNGGISLSFSYNRARWSLSNDGTGPLTIKSINLERPTTNRDLNSVRLGGVTIFNQRRDEPSTFVDSGWVGTTADRRLQPGDNKTLELHFDRTASTRPSDYTILVEFEEGCSMLFVIGGPASEDFLRLRDDRARPFFAWGNTPLDGVLSSFESWYETWEPLAEAADPEFATGCRQVFVILLTDGFETCNGNPVAAAQSLLGNQGIPTYVIGFAVDNPQLDAIAIAGGTDSDPADPSIAHYPASDQAVLVGTLNAIIQDIKSNSRTFASAAVSSVHAEEGNQIYLTSVGPVSGASVWPGRIDAFLKPILFATTPEGLRVPDRRDSALCGEGEQENCRVWGADSALLAQAPDEDEILSGILRLGDRVDERRVFFSRPAPVGSLPAERVLFSPLDNGSAQLDLYGPGGMGLDPMSNDFVADGENVIKQTLVEKRAVIEDPITTAPTTVDYVLGDIFHSDPQIWGAPNNFGYFTADLPGRSEPCGPRIDGGVDLHPPYACFAEAHRHRRRIVLVGSNDGQVHAFDAGQPERIDGTGGTFEVEFQLGTGHELFSYIPRTVLPALTRMARGGNQEFTVDGAITIDDVVIDPIHDGIPEPDERQWRTVALGGLREGGAGYYALDITQPDKLDQKGVPVANTYVPSCLDGANGCGISTLPGGGGTFPNMSWPTVLWEFTDTWDEDGNAAPDLAATWSRANTGRVKILESDGSVGERYVAIFGGGMDADFKHDPVDEGDPEDPSDDVENPRGGNFLYMIDIETGEILYKRRLDVIGGFVYPAMAPSTPAAVDANFDSYLDTIYIGTTAGHMFKVDISSPQEILLTSVDDWSTNDPSTGEVPYTRSVQRITAEEWEPFPIFSTGGKPIYYPPSVVFVAQLNRYALAFGTGDREDLWNETLQEGRFYLFLDGGFTADTANLPFTEIKLEPITNGDPDIIGDLLLDIEFDPDQAVGPNPGWYMIMEADERLVSKSISVSGVVFFNSYVPEGLVPNEFTCGRGGESHLYGVLAGNGNGLHLRGEDDNDRFRVVSDFVTTPFVEAGAPPGGPGEDPPGPGEDPCSDMSALTQALQESVFSNDCSFADYTVNIMTIRSDTGIECVAPLPICILQRNWKEF